MTRTQKARLAILAAKLWIVNRTRIGLDRAARELRQSIAGEAGPGVYRVGGWALHVINVAEAHRPAHKIDAHVRVEVRKQRELA